MDHRTKGFTLIELLVTLAVFLILITLAVPAFTRSVQSNKADTEVGDLQRHSITHGLRRLIGASPLGFARRPAAVSGPAS